MSALTSCFSQLLSLALLALPVMAVVLLARQLLAKAPKKYSYALWFAVWFRLACPPGLLGRLRFSLFSLRPLAPVTQAAERLDRSLAAARSAPTVPVVSPPAAPAPDLGSAALPAAPGLSAGELALEIAALVWLAGLAVLVVWGLFSWLRLRRQVSAAVREEGEVWACDGISTPFTLGLLRPRIYVPFHLAGRERTYVLVHERFHIRHRDHWVKPLVLLLLAAYWWDPAVWLCWALFCRDMEMRCDEAVLETLGDQAKAGYSASLVAFALDRPTPTALAFGEHDAGCRVKHVLQWKQARPRIAFLAVAVVAAVLIACCSNGLAGAESWMRLEESASVGGFQQLRFTYQLAEEYRSCLLYTETYEGGVLTGRMPVGAWSLGADETATGEADRPHQGSVTLRAEAVEDWTVFRWRGAADTGDGAATELDFGQILTTEAFTGLGWMSLCKEPGETAALGEDTAVAVACLSTSPGGAVYDFTVPTGAQPPTEALRNDLVCVLRLRLSELDRAALEAAFAGERTDAAQTLFDLRSDYIGDAPAAGRLLDALGTGELGAYTLELFTAERPYILQVNFRDQPGDSDPTSRATDLAMLDRATVLLALIGNLDQVNWTYPSREDGAEVRITGTCDAAQADALAQSLGYGGIKDLGQTAAGIRALLAAWDGGEMLAAATLAERLFAARNDPAALLAVLGAAETLGTCTIEPAAAGQLVLRFYDSPADPALRDTVLWKYSMVLLALTEDYQETSWNWEDGGAPALPENAGLWDTGTWLAEQGLPGSIRDYGASPQTVETLLKALYPNGFEAETAAPAAGRVAGVEPTGDVPYPAMGGVVGQMDYTLPAGSRRVGFQTETYDHGELIETQWVWTGDVGAGLPASGQFWVTCAYDKGNWDGRLLWTVTPWAAAEPLASFTTDLPGRWRNARYAACDRQTLQREITLPEGGSAVLFAACANEGDEAPVPADVAALNDPAAVERLTAANDAVVLLRMALSEEGLPAVTAEPFTGVLGYDGVARTQSVSWWAMRTYYARQGGVEFPIAESFGYDLEPDTLLDLDGDGAEELICNVTYGADGARRAYVYQRRADGIYRGSLVPRDLPGFSDWGVGAWWAEYHPAAERFSIYYNVDGAADYAQVDYTPAEALERMEWYPYPG